jgi:hypothetical protein
MLETSVERNDLRSSIGVAGRMRRGLRVWWWGRDAGGRAHDNFESIRTNGCAWNDSDVYGYGCGYGAAQLSVAKGRNEYRGCYFLQLYNAGYDTGR